MSHIQKIINDNFNNEIVTIIRLTKINELPDAVVPNNISVGIVREGMVSSLLNIGESFTIVKSISSFFTTSEVRDIKDDKIYTLNSVYKIEILDKHKEKIGEDSIKAKVIP